MTNSKLPMIMLGLSVLLGAGGVFAAQAGQSSGGGLIAAAILALALGASRSVRFKGAAFTLVIFAAVALGWAYPQSFQVVNGFELKALMVPLLQLIMFGMGTAISFGDFGDIARAPKPIAIGVACQFTIMPIVGVTLATLAGLPPEIAAGVVLIGSSPSGLASNVMAYLAKANLALSVSLTIVATLLAPLMTPLLMKLLAGQFIEINAVNMMWGITKIVIFPVVAGVLVNHFFKALLPVLNRIMPLISMFGIAFIITLIIAAGRDSLADVAGVLLLVCIAHNLAGYALGYMGARVFGADEATARTISFEVGMQNGGLASGIALQLGKVATLGLAPAIFSALMNITGSSLANFWASRPPKTG